MHAGAKEKRKSLRRRYVQSPAASVRTADSENDDIKVGQYNSIRMLYAELFSISLDWRTHQEDKEDYNEERRAAAGSPRGERSASERSKAEESCQRLQGKTCRPKSNVDMEIRTRKHSSDILHPTGQNKRLQCSKRSYLHINFLREDFSQKTFF